MKRQWNQDRGAGGADDMANAPNKSATAITL
jgi:hypothetical protein